MEVFGNDGGISVIFILSKHSKIHSLIANIVMIEYNVLFQRCYTMIAIRDYMMELSFDVFLNQNFLKRSSLF